MQRPYIAAIRLGFVAALAFTLYRALLTADGVNFIPWDKARHFIAFYALTVLAAAGWPRTRPVLIGAALSAFGVLIELLQALPVINRDADVWDWVADSLAIAAALGPMLLAPLRRWAAKGAGKRR